MTNREKMIECLVQSYKENLITVSNYKLAKEVFNNMNCKNCPLRTEMCGDGMTCFQKAYEFIEESEIEE